MTKEIYILYIEDDHPMIELVRRTLELSGYKVKWAISGRQGLTMIRERKPDLLLLDLMMPDINGWDVYREMRTDENLADVPIIIITALTPKRDRVIIEDLPPANDYITKPFDVEHLIHAVQTFL